MATETDFILDLVVEAIKDQGGHSSVLEISRYIWDNYEDELRSRGDLFYRWQYVLRWSGTKLRKKGILLPATHSPQGIWVLA